MTHYAFLYIYLNRNVTTSIQVYSRQKSCYRLIAVFAELPVNLRVNRAELPSLKLRVDQGFSMLGEVPSVRKVDDLVERQV